MATESSLAGSQVPHRWIGGRVPGFPWSENRRWLGDTGRIRTTYRKSLFALVLTVAAGGCGLGRSDVVDLRASVSGPTTLRVGESTQYIATVESIPASYLMSPQAQAGVVWSSSQPAVADVVARDELLPGGVIARRGGLVTARAPGQVVITATPQHFEKFVRGQITPGSITITIVE